MDNNGIFRFALVAMITVGIPSGVHAQASTTTCTLNLAEDGTYRGTCRRWDSEEAIFLSPTAENAIFTWTGTVQSRSGDAPVHLAPPSDIRI